MNVMAGSRRLLALNQMLLWKSEEWEEKIREYWYGITKEDKKERKK
jgi:hypothetical protein